MLLRSRWVRRHLSAQVGPGADHGDLRSPPTQALGLKFSAHDLARVPSIRPAAFGLANRPHGRRQRLRTGLSKPKLVRWNVGKRSNYRTIALDLGPANQARRGPDTGGPGRFVCHSAIFPSSQSRHY
jgi:hypothetical protein